jgi:hypothetical protein
MADSTTGDQLSEEYAVLLPHIRRTSEQLETEVMYPAPDGGRSRPGVPLRLKSTALCDGNFRLGNRTRFETVIDSCAQILLSFVRLAIRSEPNVK